MLHLVAVIGSVVEVEELNEAAVNGSALLVIGWAIVRETIVLQSDVLESDLIKDVIEASFEENKANVLSCRLMDRLPLIFGVVES